MDFLHPRRAGAAVLAVGLSFLAACGARSLVPVSANFQVVAEFYPLYVTLLNLTDGVPGVQVSNLVPTATGCPEDYQLTPGDMKTLMGANVFIINGTGLEGYLGKLAAQCPQLKVVDASAGIALLKIEGEDNPHLWVSPLTAARQTRNIAAALATADPAHASLYRKNGEAYATRQEGLAAHMRDVLAPAPVRRFVAFHDSLPYLARDLNLEMVAILEPAPGQNPSARELADVAVRVRSASGQVALLTEIDAKNPAAEVLSRELGRPLYSLDTVTTGPLEPAAAKEAYFRAMDKNLSTLRIAFGLDDYSARTTAAH